MTSSRVGIEFDGNAGGAVRAARETRGAVAGVARTVAETAAENIQKQVQERQALEKLVAEYRQAGAAAKAGSREQVTAANLAAEAERRLARTHATTAHEQANLARQAGSAERELGKLSRGAVASSGVMHGLGRQVAYASGAFLGAYGVVGVFKQTVTAAEALVQQQNRTTAVFGTQARAVEAWSHRSVTSMHATSAEALKLADNVGTVLHAMSVAPTAAASYSTSLAQVAVKLAAVKDADPSEVIDAIDAAVRGRGLRLAEYGIRLDQTALKEEALRLGLVKATVSTRAQSEADTQLSIARAKLAAAQDKYGAGTTQVAAAQLAVQHAEDAVKQATAGHVLALTNAQRAQAAYSLIMERSGFAAEGFARRSHTLAGEEDLLRASLSQTEEEIGLALLPTITRYVGEAAHWLSSSENQRRVTEEVVHVVRELAGGVDEAAHVVKAFAGPIETVANDLGGWKNVIEGVIALKFGFWVVGAAKDLRILRTAEDEAAASAARLRLGLLSLGGAEVLAAIAAAGAAYAAFQTVTTQTYPGARPSGQGANSTSSGSTLYTRGGVTYEVFPGARPGRGEPFTGIAADGSEYRNGKLVSGPPVTHGPGGAHSGAGTIYGKSLTGEDPLLTSGLDALKQAGYSVDVISAKRSTALQAQLYARYVRSGFNRRYIAAKPGTSDHEFGRAADILINGKPAASYGNAFLAKYGLVAPVAGDMPHVTALGGAGQQLPGAGGGGGGGPAVVTGPGGSLVVGTAPPKPPKPAVLTGAALIPDAINRQISALQNKISNASTDSAAVTLLQQELAALERARGKIGDNAKVHNAKQAQAIADETTRIDNEIRDVHAKIRDALGATAVATVVARFKTKLDADKDRYERLQVRAQYDTGAALTDDFAAVAGALEDQRQTLLTERDQLTGRLRGAGRRTTSAIKAQVTKINSELDQVSQNVTSNLQAQASTLQGLVSAQQARVATGFSRVQGAIIAEFERQTQAHIDALAGQFFQGAQTPLEQQLASMQADDAAKSLQDALQQAIASGDPAAIAAAQRAIVEANLAIAAQRERADADRGYADAVRRWTDERTAKEAQLGRALDDLGVKFEAGTATTADLTAVAAEYGVNLDALSGSSVLVQGDMVSLSTSVQTLRDLMDQLAAKIREIVSGGGGGTGGSGGGSGGPNAGTAATSAFVAGAAAAVAAGYGGYVHSPGATDASPHAPDVIVGGHAVYGFAAGGEVPGRFVGREDTAPAFLTPGEEVIDRSLSRDLRAFLSGAGGRQVVVVQSDLYVGARRLASATARDMTLEQGRRVAYRYQR